jgi:hypothetical protein
MVNYEFIKSLDNDLFLQMVRRGIIPVHIMDWITVYDFYLNELKSKTKVQSLLSSAEYFNCTDKTIYNIINFMKK